MSDTPQTDAVFHWYYDSNCSRYAVIDKFAELCFKLERENAALRADKERLDWVEQNADDASWLIQNSKLDSIRDTIDAAMKEAKP